MKKVLFIVSNIRASNGVTSVVMNHYPDLVENGYSVDFCSMYDRSSPWFEELRRNESNYCLLPQVDEKHSGPDYEKSKGFLEKKLADEKYDIIHIHITGKYAALVARLAKKAHVPYRIYHAHNPLYIHDIHSALYTLAYHVPCVHSCNKYLACSNHAGKSYFGNKKFDVIRNTVDTKSVKFDSESRNKLRNTLGVKDETVVIGTVCRHTKQKNPFFIVDVFEQYHKKNNDSVLMWVGTGELEQEVKKYIGNKGLDNAVISMGNQTDMKAMYSAMDLFLLPSLYEGLGIVFIEAQANGLPVLASGVVPRDTEVTELIHYISLKKDAKGWVYELEQCLNNKEIGKRTLYAEMVRLRGYDKKNNHDLLQYYKSFSEGE